MSSQVLMGKGASKSDKELASSILAGEMKNAWQAEDRPNIPDTRPAVWRPQHKLVHSRTYVQRYDLIDWSK